MSRYRYQIVTHVKVEKFIEKLDNVRKARIDRFYDLFEEYGTLLSGKYLKKINKDIWELRPGDIRLFLTIRRKQAFVIHGIHKKSQKIPKKELKLIIRRTKKEID